MMLQARMGQWWPSCGSPQRILRQTHMHMMVLWQRCLSAITLLLLLLCIRLLNGCPLHNLHA